MKSTDPGYVNSHFNQHTRALVHAVTDLILNRNPIMIW